MKTAGGFSALGLGFAGVRLARALAALGLTLLVLEIVSPAATAQTREWGWMGGSSTKFEVLPVYGTLGISAAGNTPGGREEMTTTTDSHGNLWAFGGDGYTNDLWMFNSATREWTWLGGTGAFYQSGMYGTLGTPSPGNVPAGRSQGFCWVDASGHFWLFGGYGYYGSGYGAVQAPLNDLWEFNPSTREWTWWAGSPAECQGCALPGVYGTLGTPSTKNLPGGRSGGNAWSDSHGHFWLFGGAGAGSTSEGGFLNDLWEFDPTSREWTWISGSNVIPSNNSDGAAPGVYGTLGKFAPGNVPGGRYGSANWVDTHGNFWIMGGDGPNYIDNDLWEFNPSTREWAWMSGGKGGLSGVDYNGVYGSLGVFAAQNVPGSRYWASAWTDPTGNLWLYAGVGFASSGGDTVLNDMWQFNPTTREWAWMDGNKTPAPINDFCYPGVYGTLGKPAPGNIPGAREVPAAWADSSGNFWIFGGFGCGTSPTADGDLDDLWAYALPPAATPTFSLPSGTYATPQTVTIADATTGATLYFTMNGTTPTAASTRYSTEIPVNYTQTIKAVAMAGGHFASNVATVKYTIPIQVTLGPSSARLALGGTQVFTATIKYAANTALRWYVNGVLNGNSTQGTLTGCTTVAPRTCKYTAPSKSAPSPNPAVIKVVSAEDLTKYKTASVTVGP